MEHPVNIAVPSRRLCREHLDPTEGYPPDVPSGPVSAEKRTEAIERRHDRSAADV